MRLIILERNSMMAELTATDKAVLIGSHPACDVYLPDGRLAPRQVLIEPEGETGWSVRPLETDVVATLNKTLLRGKFNLKTGDEISMLDYTIRVYLTEHPEPAVTAAVTEEETAKRPSPAQRWTLPADTVILGSPDTVNVDAAGITQLGQIVSVLHQSDQVAELLVSLAGQLVSALGADCAWACLATDPEHEPHMSYAVNTAGAACDPPDKTALLVHRTVQRQQSILLPTEPARYASAMAAPLTAGAATLGLIHVQRQPGKPAYGRMDLAMLRIAGTLAGIRVDELLRGQDKVLKQRGQEQLEWVHQVQDRLAPAELPQWSNMEAAVHRIAGKAYSGDMYDVIRLPKGTAAVLLGHAVATGIESALLMAEVRAGFRVALVHADAPHFVMRELNWLVHEPSVSCKLQCFVGLVDPATGVLHYSAAGKPGAYLLKPDGQAIHLLPKQDPEIGTEPNPEYHGFQSKLAPGDSLVLFTEGLVTATNAAGEAFGFERALDAVTDVADKSANLIVQALADDLASHLGSEGPSDDLTVLLVRKMP